MIQKNWQELIKPNKIEFSSKKKTLTTLVAEPLERYILQAQTGISHLHVYPFGGIEASIDWLRARGSWV